MVDRAALAWGGLGLLGLVALPWSRGPGSRPAGPGLLATSGGAAVVAVALLAAVAASLGAAPGTAGRLRRHALLVSAAIGTAGALVLAARGPAPAGPGALVVVLSLLTLAGLGLDRAALVRGGGFVGAAILWAALLVALFVVYPLAAMLQASVVVDGRLTTAAVARTLASPAFLLLAHESFAISAAAGAAGGALAGVLAAAGSLAWRRPR